MGFKVAARAAVSLPPFSKIAALAMQRKGPDFLEENRRRPSSSAELRKRPDDRYLSRMAQGIFSAGFVWKIVEHKWPSFEEAFAGFDIERAANLDDVGLDALVADKRVIRNRPKLTAVRDNARFIRETRLENGGFGTYLAGWAPTNVVGLLAELSRRGSRLGGFTGPMFLRHVGFDTFMLTQDVVKALMRAGVVDKHPTSKRDMAATQEAFNVWHEQSGLPMCQLSQTLAFSIE